MVPSSPPAKRTLHLLLPPDISSANDSMGEESLLSRHRRTDLEICGTHQHTESLGPAFMEATALCGEYTHTTTPKDQRGRQPLRSPMAFVFRAKGKRFDG